MGDQSSNSRTGERLAYEVDYVVSDHVNGKFPFISHLIHSGYLYIILFC